MGEVGIVTPYKIDGIASRLTAFPDTLPAILPELPSTHLADGYFQSAQTANSSGEISVSDGH
jgi:hypothetical protein